MTGWHSTAQSQVPHQSASQPVPAGPAASMQSHENMFCLQSRTGAACSGARPPTCSFCQMRSATLR